MIAAESKDARRNFQTSIGSVLTAALFWTGIYLLVAALKVPLAALLVFIINFLIEWKHLQWLPLAEPSLFWNLQMEYAVTGLIVLALSTGIGLWLHPKRTR